MSKMYRDENTGERLTAYTDEELDARDERLVLRVMKEIKKAGRKPYKKRHSEFGEKNVQYVIKRVSPHGATSYAMRCTPERRSGKKDSHDYTEIGVTKLDMTQFEWSPVPEPKLKNQEEPEQREFRLVAQEA